MDIRTEQGLAQFSAHCEAVAASVFPNQEQAEEMFAGLTTAEKRDLEFSLHNSFRDKTQRPVTDFLEEIRGPNWTYEDYEDPAFDDENQEVLRQARNIRDGIGDRVFLQKWSIENNEEIRKHYAAEQAARDAKVSVDGIEYQVIKKFDVMWSGWESDANAWIVETGQGRKLVIGDHGEMKFSTADFLKERMAAYQQAIDDAREAMDFIE